MSFPGLAALLLPADPGRNGAIVETDDRWSLPATRDAAPDVLVWGRSPVPTGTPVLRATRSAMARERALRTLRRHGVGSSRLAGLHRLAPPLLAGGASRNRLRAAVLGGAAAELWNVEQVRRVIDAVAEAAGGGMPVARFTPGSGGSVLAQMSVVAGGNVILRAAVSGDPADPCRAARALATLEPIGSRYIPRLFGQGETAGASWTTESVLPGVRPVRISRAVAQEVAAFGSSLPRSEVPATAHSEDLEAIADRFPRWGTVISHLAGELNDVARSVPSVIRHGDLWAGNLLVRRRRLAGVVDWDAWHPSALPGTDLLHLVATDEALRGGRSLGQAWLGRPWTGESFRSISSAYWASLRIAPNPRFLDAVGAAWWAGSAAGSLLRLPHLAQDAGWVASNVDRVLEALAGGGPSGAE